jgi:hypothetical protein
VESSSHLLALVVAVLVAAAAAIVTSAFLWATLNGSLREDDQEQIDRRFWAIVGRLEPVSGDDAA